MWRKECYIFLCLCLMVWGQSPDDANNRQRREKSSLFLEMAEHLIMISKEMIPDCAETVENTSECRTKVKLSASLEMAQKLMSEARQSYPTCNSEYPKSRDCTELWLSGQRTSGVYTIWIDSSSLKNRTLQVFCDMDTGGGGWMVIQRRGNFTPQEDFYRDWKDYKEGFGGITKDFWIGNDNLFAITDQSDYRVKFDLEDVRGNKKYAVYDTFWIEDETAKYRLHIDGYRGRAGDSMMNSNDMNFSTKDRDNDSVSRHCARDYDKGGWWYRDCGYSNPNGPYRPGVDDSSTMFWWYWQRYVGMAATEIKLKRKFE